MTTTEWAVANTDGIIVPGTVRGHRSESIRAAIDLFRKPWLKIRLLGLSAVRVNVTVAPATMDTQ